MEQDIDLMKVEIPIGIDDAQAERARQYVEATVIRGMTIKQFSEEYGVSTATIYNERHLKNPVFNKYIQLLTNECIGDDDLSDHIFIANKIKENAMKPNASQKEFDLYIRAWGWMFDYMKHQKLQELGVTTDGKPVDTSSVEDKKNRLLKRLQNKGDK